jgi:O-antigen ligase
LAYASYAGLRRNDTRVHSNNMYIEVLVGGGIVAALVFFNLAGRAAGVCVDALRRSGTRGTVAMGVVAACLAIAVHGCVDSFLSFAPTYILFSLTVGLAAASARGVETGAHAHRV